MSVFDCYYVSLEKEVNVNVSCDFFCYCFLFYLINFIRGSLKFVYV